MGWCYSLRPTPHGTKELFMAIPYWACQGLRFPIQRRDAGSDPVQDQVTHAISVAKTKKLPYVKQFNILWKKWIRNNYSSWVKTTWPKLNIIKNLATLITEISIKNDRFHKTIFSPCGLTLLLWIAIKHSGSRMFDPRDPMKRNTCKPDLCTN